MYKVNGDWESWTSWSSCSKDCKKTRSRKCDSPTPANGGSNCPGSSKGELTCTGNYCLGNKFMVWWRALNAFPKGDCLILGGSYLSRGNDIVAAKTTSSQKVTTQDRITHSLVGKHKTQTNT